MNNIVNEIKMLIASILSIDINRLEDKTTINDIASWNSMKHLEIIIQLEQVFNITINEEEVVGLISLGKIIELVKKKLEIAN